MKLEKSMQNIVESPLAKFTKLKCRMHEMATLPHFFYLVKLVTQEALVSFPCTRCLREMRPRISQQAELKDGWSQHPIISLCDRVRASPMR